MWISGKSIESEKFGLIDHNPTLTVGTTMAEHRTRLALLQNDEEEWTERAKKATSLNENRWCLEQANIKKVLIVATLKYMEEDKQ